MTESDGKATGWKAFYRNGAWETMEKAVTVRKTIRKKTKAAKKKTKASKAAKKVAEPTVPVISVPMGGKVR
jgi:DNA topoisomerase-1